MCLSISEQACVNLCVHISIYVYIAWVFLWVSLFAWCVFACMSVCQFHHQPGTRGKQWIFPEGGKTTVDLYFPSPSPFPSPPTTYYFHWTGTLSHREKALAEPSRLPCAECSETWTPPSALTPPHTSPGGADPSLRSPLFPC